MKPLTELVPGIPLHTTNEYILERPRWKWIVSMAKAFVASTDIHLRWLIIQAGYDEFHRLCKEKFRQFEPAITPTDDEIRWIWQVLPQTLPPRFREALRAAEIERFVGKAMTEKDLKAGSTGEDPTGHDGPTHDMGDGITVETVPDRDKKPIEVTH